VTRVLHTAEKNHQVTRRVFLRRAIAATCFCAPCIDLPGAGALLASPSGTDVPDPGLKAGWLARWEKNILGRARTRHCDREMGEQLGWLVSPFLSGFYYGWLATNDPVWVERMGDWAEAWMSRAVADPAGFPSWPKQGGASTSGVPDFYIDNQLGEAMALEPIMQMAAELRTDPNLRPKWEATALAWVRLAERLFEKWDTRGCWREVKEGGLWVVPPFGIDRETGQWTGDYKQRQTGGFSQPPNKQNHIARWLIALHKATGKPLYRQRAEQWWRLMRSRMRTREDGRYFVWNYWDPAGPWDYHPDGRPKHWVGVHPNGGYYGIDVEGIVTAWEQKLVFSREDIERLIATNRDFMWNQQIREAGFRRIDGGQPDARWKNSPGILWRALVPYDATLRRIFEANHDPSGWGAVAVTPRYFTRHAQAARPLTGDTP
jgi:hypothetical protein